MRRQKENAYNQSERYRLSNLTIDRKAYIRTYEQYEKFAIDVLGKWRIDLDSHLRGFFRHASEEYDL